VLGYTFLAAQLNNIVIAALGTERIGANQSKWTCGNICQPRGAAAVEVQLVPYLNWAIEVAIKGNDRSNSSFGLEVSPAAVVRIFAQLGAAIGQI